MAERWRLDKRKETPPRAKLGKRELLVDVAHATGVLEEVYAARDLIPKADLLLARFAIRGLARGRARWDTRTVCERIDGALMLLPDDQFSASLDGRPCSEARRERLAETGAVGANVASRGDKAWAETVVAGAGEGLSGAGTPVLSLTHFAPAGTPAWDGLREKILALRAERPAVTILDVRGNPGGHESGAEAAAALLFGTARAPAPEGSVARSRNLASLAALMNASWTRSRAPEADPAAAREFAAYRDEYLKARARPTPGLRIEEWSGPSSPGRGVYPGQLLVLADRGCSGACERFLLRLKRMPNVRLIGEATAGASSSLDFGLVRLPQSGIEIRVPTAVLLAPDGSFAGREGIAVDVAVPAGRDALTYAREILPRSGP